MKPTPEQARAIMRWGHQHRQMLRENYRHQFVATEGLPFKVCDIKIAASV